MSTQLTRQEQLFGEVEERYGEITVPNKDLWPFFRVVNTLVDECRLHSDGSTFSVSSTGPANVAMVDVECDLETSIPWTEPIGIHVDYLHGRLQNKPRSENDSVDVTLDVAEPYGSINVSEEIDSTKWHLSERLDLISTEAVRDDAELQDLDDFTASIEVPVGRVYSFIRNKPQDNHIELSSNESIVRIGEAAGETDYTAALEIDKATGEATSMYDPDYFEDMFKALWAIGVENVTVEWGEDFPCQFHFEKNNVSGMFMLAPRVQA